MNNQPIIEIHDSSLWLEYGFEHSNEDWNCKSCRSINFKHREICFKCSKPKFISPPINNNGQDDVSIQPTRFLLIRNIDENVTARKV